MMNYTEQIHSEGFNITTRYNIKSCASMSDAIYQCCSLGVQYKETKLKSTGNVSSDIDNILKAAHICKAIISFANHSKEFSRYYKYRVETHIMWNPSTFKIEWMPRSYTFVLHMSRDCWENGYPYYFGSNQDGRVYCRFLYQIETYIERALNELKRNLPSARYEEVRNKFLNICQS